MRREYLGQSTYRNTPITIDALTNGSDTVSITATDTASSITQLDNNTITAHNDEFVPVEKEPYIRRLSEYELHSCLWRHLSRLQARRPRPQRWLGWSKPPKRRRHKKRRRV